MAQRKKTTNSNTLKSVYVAVAGLAALLLGAIAGWYWAASRATATPMPAAAAPTATAAPTAAPCPSPGEASAILHADVQPLGGEACAFVRRVFPDLETWRCPPGWVCTFADRKGVWLAVGDGNRFTAGAGTFRYLPAYPPGDAVHEPCMLLTKEQQFGSQHGYAVRPANFACTIEAP